MKRLRCMSYLSILLILPLLLSFAPQKVQEEPPEPDMLGLPWSGRHEEVLFSACYWMTNFGRGELYFLCMGSAGYPASASTATNFIRDLPDPGPDVSDPTLSRMVLNTTFSGYHAGNVTGYDLLSELEHRQMQSAEEIALQLLAFDSNAYQPGQNWLRSDSIDALLAMQNEDGGFSGGNPSISSLSTTATVLTALAPYQEDDSVRPSLQRGISYLAEAQNPGGGYSTSGQSNAILTAKVIITLSSMQIPVTDTRFMIDDVRLDEVLFRYLRPDGGFGVQYGDDSDIVATEYAVLAMASLKSGRTPYRLSLQLNQSEAGLPDEYQQLTETVAESTGRRMPVDLFIVTVVGSGFLFFGFRHWRKRRKSWEDNTTGFKGG